MTIHKDLLRMIINNNRNYHLKTKNQPYLEKLYSAMFMAGYYGLLRVGELAKGPHVILAANTHIGVNKNKILFMLQMSKTHNKGSKPQRIKITEL